MQEVSHAVEQEPGVEEEEDGGVIAVGRNKNAEEETLGNRIYCTNVNDMTLTSICTSFARRVVCSFRLIIIHTAYLASVKKIRTLRN